LTIKIANNFTLPNFTFAQVIMQHPLDCGQRDKEKFLSLLVVVMGLHTPQLAVVKERHHETRNERLSWYWL